MVSKLIFGTLRAAGEFDGLVTRRRNERQSERLIEAAFEAGFRSYDTAPLYAMGRAEEVLSSVLSGTKSEVYTKVGVDISRKPVPELDYSIEGLTRSLGESLRRLKSLPISAVYIHNPPAEIIGGEAIYEFLASVQSRLGSQSKRGISLATIRDGLKIPTSAPIDILMISERDSRCSPIVYETLREKYRIVLREIFFGGNMLHRENIRRVGVAKFVEAYTRRIISVDGRDVIVAPRTCAQLSAYRELLQNGLD